MINWPPPTGAHFPIPRISEGFLDDVVRRAGGERLDKVWNPPPGKKNADYLFPGAIAELKILEEEGLLKESRQDKVAKLLRALNSSGEDVELNFESLGASVRSELEDLLLEPIQGAVRKASKQLVETRASRRFGDRCAVLIAVNSGYSSLPAELFEGLVLRSCRKDTSQIDFLVCLSVRYHQGSFDAFVFFKRESFSVQRSTIWPEAEAFMHAATEKFGEAMTVMMRDQMNPNLWEDHLAPVRDIIFERDGVTYVRRAREVPDSRFNRNI